CFTELRSSATLLFFESRPKQIAGLVFERHSMRSVCSVGLLLAVLHHGWAGDANDWPQWRGRLRNGTWQESALPDRFPAEGIKARWRRPIGGGYGGIAATGGRVYLMDRQTQPREVERLVCLEAATGKRVWAQEYPVKYGKMDYGNGPRSTPTV